MSGRRILILEQDQKIRELLTRFLKARGYEVTGTHDADNGLRLFLAERPDVILVDLVLADGPGADLCRQVRDTHLDVALILMGTARQARRRGIENVRAELGIDSFLQKPFGIADLVTAIESALTVSAARGAPAAAPTPAEAPKPAPTPTPTPAGGLPLPRPPTATPAAGLPLLRPTTATPAAGLPLLRPTTPTPAAGLPLLRPTTPTPAAGLPLPRPPTPTAGLPPPRPPSASPAPATASAPPPEPAAQDAGAARLPPLPGRPTGEQRPVTSESAVIRRRDPAPAPATPEPAPAPAMMRIPPPLGTAPSMPAVEVSTAPIVATEPLVATAPMAPPPSAADDQAPADSFGSAAGLLASESGDFPSEISGVYDPSASFEAVETEVASKRGNALYPVREDDDEEWGLDSLQLDAIRHGPVNVADAEHRYAMSPLARAAPNDPEGIYGEVAFAQLLYNCFRDLFSGRLTLRHGQAVKMIRLVGGRPIAAESNIRSESLGFMLFREGVIDQRQLRESVRICRREGVLQGRVLVRLGAIDDDMLSQALRRQLRMRVLDCFAWTGAEYGLNYDPNITRAGDNSPELNPLVLIFDGIKTRFPIAPLVDHFDAYARRPARATTRLRDYATMLRGFGDAFGVAELCDGGRVLGEVLALSPYGLVDTLRMLRALEITGCLEFGRAVSGNTFAASVRTTPSLHTLDSDEAPAVRLRRVTGEQERVRRVRTSDTSIDATLDRSVDGSISGEETPERSTDRGRRRRSRPRPRETGPDLIKAETNFSKGKRSLDAEEIEQAIAHFQLACRQDPHQPLFRMYLAWAQYQGAPPNDRKARFEAQEQLKAALEADGGQDEGFVLLGNVFRTQGNAEGALKNYRRALELNRRNAAARAAVRELEGTEEKKERDNPGLFKFFRR